MQVSTVVLVFRAQVVTERAKSLVVAKNWDKTSLFSLSKKTEAVYRRKFKIALELIVHSLHKWNQSYLQKLKIPLRN